MHHKLGDFVIERTNTVEKQLILKRYKNFTAGHRLNKLAIPVGDTKLFHITIGFEQIGDIPMGIGRQINAIDIISNGKPGFKR